MTTPIISIIMPVYNGERHVAQAIESALTQTHSDIELLIVNDGSTDNSRNVIHSYLTDPRIRYFEQNNQGVASARNVALAEAKGKYVGFLDQDDVWLSDKLAKQVNFFEKNQDVTLVHARQEYIDEIGRPLDTSFTNIEPINGLCFPILFEKNRIAVLTVLVKTDALRSIGGFNKKSSRADDYEAWMKIAWDHQIGFLDDIVAKYRVHSKNQSHDCFKMTLADLSAIQAVLNDITGAKKKLGHKWKNRLSHLHGELAAWYGWKYQDKINSRKHAKLALQFNPTSLKAWRSFIWQTLPKNLQRRICWWKHRLCIAKKPS